MSGRLVVIGAGSSGITAVKNALDAGFTDITCYERRDVMGGLWYFTEKKAEWEDESCVNRATVINTSKEFMTFSDYPMPDEYPNFCHNVEVEDYFIDYAKHFGVDKYVKFNTEVLSLNKHQTYNSTGKWELKLVNHKTGEEKSEVFDFCIVANGHHGAPNRPVYPGQDKFKGTILHSKEFKDVRGWEGKRAVVVGIGNSGGDISVELSKYTRVFLATRRGAWILNRITENGLPWDYNYHNRHRTWILSVMPRSWKVKAIKKKLNERFDHNLYHMTPLNEPDATHPTVNDDMPNRIVTGTLKVKPNIKSFTETGVYFDDGSFEDNIDLVVYATGYKVEYPFIAKDIINIKNNKVEMFRHMFVPDLSKQTIAFLAVCQPLGAMFPIAELQSRLAFRVFKGEVVLPSSADMRKDIEAHAKAVQSRYVHTERHTIQVDWLPYMDELATLCGCKPNLWKLLVTDPALFWKVFFGPGVPYQYRLHGPNTWPGARDAIFTVWDRVSKPFNTRLVPSRTRNRSSSLISLKTVFLLGAIAGGLYYAKKNDIDLGKYVPQLNKLQELLNRA